MTYNWRDDWDWERIEKTRKKKGLGQTRYNNSDKFYAAIRRAIVTRHKTLKHEMIDNCKTDGYTFGEERRKSKTGKVYPSYLYRQKRNVNGKPKEHISLKAKDLDDYRDNILLKQAIMDVFRDKIGGWIREGLTPSEEKTLNIILEEYLSHPRQDGRNPVIQKYIKQLGLKVKNRKFGITRFSKALKRLKAAKKALIKQNKARKKLREIIDIASKGDQSRNALVSFIRNAIKESKCRHSVKALRNYIKQCIMQDGASTPYSILTSREIRWVAVEMIWIDKRIKDLPF